jgi:amino acid transporter
MVAARLPKELNLRDVYTIATGATLSAGLFLLPGLAGAQAGPGIVLCYMLAAVPIVPAMLAMVELATAMPRAGGAYSFQLDDRLLVIDEPEAIGQLYARFGVESKPPRET